ncbi:MAG: HPr(Ser) kinase/phosphatase [Opitutales bacterium]|nr:HPr(Ser) kinase/phosphatase [Opitutales bacterium]
MLTEARPIVTEKISVKEFYDRNKDTLKLALLAGEGGLDKQILEKSLNRPALALTKYFKNFAVGRLQVFGAGEMSFLNDIGDKEQRSVLHEMAIRGIPGMIIARNITPTDEMIKISNEDDVPLLQTSLSSQDFATDAVVALDEIFSPKVMLHGTLIDVKGIGVLIRGKSGVGKSECALALIEKGHSLVADDTTYVNLYRDQELVGTSSELNRGYMECRGIGIINITNLFGVRAVRIKKKIDLVITFVLWEQGMDEERTGLEETYLDVLDQKVPHMEIPVRPGRDMARLVEVACMVHALKLIGHDSAKEFNEHLIAHMQKQMNG